MEFLCAKDKMRQVTSPTHPSACNIFSIVDMANQGWTDFALSTNYFDSLLPTSNKGHEKANQGWTDFTLSTNYFDGLLSTSKGHENGDTSSVSTASSEDSRFSSLRATNSTATDETRTAENSSKANPPAYIPQASSNLSRNVLGISLMDQIMESEDESEDGEMSSCKDPNNEQKNIAMTETDTKVLGDSVSDTQSKSFVQITAEGAIWIQEDQMVKYTKKRARQEDQGAKDRKKRAVSESNNSFNSTTVRRVKKKLDVVADESKTPLLPPEKTACVELKREGCVAGTQSAMTTPQKKRKGKMKEVQPREVSKGQKISSASPFKSKHNTTPSGGKIKSIVNVVEKHEQQKHELELENQNDEEKVIQEITADYLRKRDSKNTDLHIICFIERNPSKVMKVINMCKSMASIANSYNEYPLHYACMNPIWAKLKERAADLSHKNRKKMTEREQKVVYKRKMRHELWGKVMRALIEAYPAAAREENMERCVPLHLYCLMGAPCEEAVQAMVEEFPGGACLQSELAVPFNTSGRKSNDPSLPKKSRLLQIETPRNATTISSDNPSATKRGLVVFYLKRDSFLQSSSSSGKQPPSRGLHRIEKGKVVPPQSKDIEVGWTPLHIAAANVSNVDSLRCIIRVAPTGWHIKTSQGRSPLDCAISSHAPDSVINVLKKYCAPSGT
jgi:hypothetical protein